VNVINDISVEYERASYNVNISVTFNVKDIECNYYYNGDNEGYGSVHICIGDMVEIEEGNMDEIMDDITDHIMKKAKLVTFCKNYKMKTKVFIEEIINIMSSL